MIDVKSEINQVLREQFGISDDRLRPDSTIREDLDLDSLDAVDLIVYLEKRSGQRIQLDSLLEVRTLGEIYQLIEALLAPQPQLAAS